MMLIETDFPLVLLVNQLILLQEIEAVGSPTFRRAIDGNGGGQGRINCVEVDPDNEDVIYAGSPGGGLWRSEDAQATHGSPSQTAFQKWVYRV